VDNTRNFYVRLTTANQFQVWHNNDGGNNTNIYIDKGKWFFVVTTCNGTQAASDLKTYIFDERGIYQDAGTFTWSSNGATGTSGDDVAFFETMYDNDPLWGACAFQFATRTFMNTKQVFDVAFDPWSLVDDKPRSNLYYFYPIGDEIGGMERDYGPGAFHATIRDGGTYTFNNVQRGPRVKPRKTKPMGLRELPAKPDGFILPQSGRDTSKRLPSYG
jgi:hypothetical protein